VEPAAVILIAIVIANFLLGLFVVLRNPLQRQGQLFFSMVTFINLWAVSNYLTDNATKLRLNDTFNRLSYLFAFLAISLAAAFIGYFTGRLRKWPVATKIFLTAAVLLGAAASVSSAIAGTVARSKTGLHFTNGNLVLLYDAVIFLMLLYILADLFLMHRRGSKMQKSQAGIVALGFGVSILAGFLANAIIPIFADNFDSAKYGPPVLSLTVVSSVSYAIVRHKLFDIRSFVVRATAYAITLAITSLLYVIPTLLLANYVLNIHLNFITIFTLGSIIILTAILFQNLRIYFNKFTAKLFYRDYYDPQYVLDRVSELLAASVDIEEIEQSFRRIMGSSIKPSQATFLLRADAHDLDDNWHQILSGLSHIHSSIINVDELADSHGTIRAKLRENNVAVALAMKTSKDRLGYLVLGYKRSGSPYSNSDLKLLGIIADELAVGLQNALRFREIQQFNITLQQKVDEATRELRQANAKLKELDHTKDEFISMASHQLRTPLTTIKGYLSMVLEGDAGPVQAKQKEMIEQSFQSASRMVYLIADLLNVSRLQSGKFVIINKPCNLATLVEGEVKQLAQQATQRQIKLSYDKPASFPMLNLDEDKVRQVVMNLLDNALYYTPSGGTVTVKLEATPESAVYTVTDTGVGVPKRLQHHLFSKFYRADNARKMRPDGTGLGLYMAKKVVTAQGGGIIFHSEEGKGSTFGFSFPRAKLELKK
jgi:signal transduction histidine kinase